MIKEALELCVWGTDVSKTVITEDCCMACPSWELLTRAILTQSKIGLSAGPFESKP